MRDLSRVFDQATELHRRGELAVAGSLYQQLLESRPDDFQVLQMLGFLRYEQGRYSEALSLMGEVLTTNPNSPAQLLNYAVVLDALRRREEAVAYYDRALAIKPDYAEALFNRGVSLHNLQRPVEALASFDRALAIRPDDADAHGGRGNALRDLRRPAEAVASYDQALAIRRHDADFLNHRGNALRDLNLTAEALASYDRALAIRPGHVEALNNRGSALRSLERPAEAVACYDKALAIDPNDAGAHYNRGNALQDLERYAEARASYDQALAVRPDYVEAFNNRGVTLQSLKLPAEALASIDQALAIKPDYVEALNNRGGALLELKRPAEALASYVTALALKPDYAEALSNRGNALQSLRRHAEALASFEKALALEPDNVKFLNDRGLSLQNLGRPAEALAGYDKALAIKPNDAEALYNRGVVLRDLQRPAEAMACFERVLAVSPDHRFAFGGMAAAALNICDWSRSAVLSREMESRIRQRNSIVAPFTLVSYGGDPALQLECAQRFNENELPASAPRLCKGTVRHDGKLRIAYLSAEFRRHPVAYLIAGLIESHDRARFEIVGISFGPDDQSDIRSRLVRAFDRFHDIRSQSDRDVAELMSRMRIDIAVDLTGHTQYNHLGVLAYRPAPVQVAYLGNPGTTGAGFIDYVIADKTILPFDQQPFYSENIVHLPDCYQVTDSKREISARTPTRREVGLPDQGFVFCCFNSNYKITPPVFDVWMRLLGKINGSVLWLVSEYDVVRHNLCKEAAARKVDPNRLIFAGRVDVGEYLARYRLADLFLDTLPYNAGATASDALWAGLPLLTCCGTTYVGRMATSLLNAAGLPELAARDLDEYEALALRLATDEALLRGFRQRLAQNRPACPLFDTDRFRQNIENAYTTMWEFQQRGESPQSFSVS